jgi:ArsR family transcriptional regulator
MNSATSVQPLLETMSCLADGTRLRLLRLLELQELGVGELGQVLQLPQPTVSRHLKTLADAKLVISRREGTSNLYRMLLDELSPAARDLWLVARERTSAWPELQQDTRRLTQLLTEKQSASQAFFANAATEWDKLRGELYGEAFTTAALLSLLPSTAVVADLACGTGTAAALLAPHVGQVIGIDNSPEMLTAARSRCAGMPNVQIRRGDLTELPIDAASCDAAMLLLALTYVAEPAQAIDDAVRVLRPGGKLVIVDLLPHGREDFRRKMNQLHAGFSAGQVQGWLAGKLVEVKTIELSSRPESKGPALLLTVGVRAAK